MLELLYIILYTKDKDYFVNCNNYSIVINTKLKMLLQQSCNIVILL